MRLTQTMARQMAQADKYSQVKRKAWLQYCNKFNKLVDSETRAIAREARNAAVIDEYFQGFINEVDCVNAID